MPGEDAVDLFAQAQGCRYKRRGAACLGGLAEICELECVEGALVEDKVEGAVLKGHAKSVGEDPVIPPRSTAACKTAARTRASGMCLRRCSIPAPHSLERHGTKVQVGDAQSGRLRDRSRGQIDAQGTCATAKMQDMRRTLHRQVCLSLVAGRHVSVRGDMIRAGGGDGGRDQTSADGLHMRHRDGQCGLGFQEPFVIGPAPSLWLMIVVPVVPPRETGGIMSRAVR
mmetsp:Transcript_118254/g.339271  ORF Transcript_118254/g.339271 Transcript_118254/m.339271 type:complete len:227 (-) Transcript_118254:200-880(-)